MKAQNLPKTSLVRLGVAREVTRSIGGPFKELVGGRQPNA